MNLSRDEQALLAEHLDRYMNGIGFEDGDYPDENRETELALEAVYDRLKTGE